MIQHVVQLVLVTIEVGHVEGNHQYVVFIILAKFYIRKREHISEYFHMTIIKVIESMLTDALFGNILQSFLIGT